MKHLSVLQFVDNKHVGNLILASVLLFSVIHMHIKMYCCFPDKNIATKK